MNIGQAKEILCHAIDDDQWVARASNNSYVTVDGVDYPDKEMLDALEQMRADGSLEQVPTPGQARSEVGYRKATVAIPH